MLRTCFLQRTEIHGLNFMNQLNSPINIYSFAATDNSFILGNMIMCFVKYHSCYYYLVFA